MSDPRNVYTTTVHDQNDLILSETTPLTIEKEISEMVEKMFDGVKFQYKYAEDRMMADLHEYLDNTYSEHYKTEDFQIECFDAWIALGDATPTFRNTALKYLWRYGKKKGNNKDDLMKSLHYTLMCLYNDHYRGK
jgi:hypothetical protein